MRVTESVADDLAKRIILSNQLGITVSVITFPYIFIFWFMGAPLLGGLVSLVVLGYALVPVLNSMGRHYSARLLPVITGSIAVTTYSIALGIAAGIHDYYMALLCFPFVLFKASEKKFIVFSSLLPIALYLFYITMGQWWGPWIEISAEMNSIISRCIEVSTGATIITALGYLYILVNISEKRLLDNIAKLNAVFESATDAIFIVDRNYRFVGVNKSTEKFVGPAPQIINKTIYELMGAEQGQYFAERYETVFNSKTPLHLEEKTRVPAGPSFYLSTVLSPIFNSSGEVEEIVGISRNVTESKLLQEKLIDAKKEAESANLAKSEFLASMSHEIRTPLGIIVGYTALMNEGANLSPANARAVDAIQRNSQHLLQLVNDILDFSKVDGRQLNIQAQPVNLEEEISRVTEQLAAPAQVKGIGILCRFAEDLPAMVNTDPLRLRQILLNLVSNAVKFSDSGNILVSVTRTQSQISVSVKDDGIGITKEQEALLFQPFSQIHPKGNPTYKGTGLGLYVARQLAEALGGHISFVSGSQGPGSEFCFSFESELKNEFLQRSGTVSEESFMGSWNLPEDFKILLVEDMLDAQNLMKLVLQKIPGATVLTANNGREGVELATQANPDIILMDINLPVLGGIAAVRELRNLGFSRPIVALTANAINGEREKCLTAGCNDYLTKPVDQPLLIESVKKLLSQVVNEKNK